MRWWRKESSHQYPWYWSSLPWIFRNKHLTARLGDPHIHGHTGPSLIQIMDCLLLHYQFWLNIHWIVVNKLQWYFNQIEPFPFIEIFCKYWPFCSGFVYLFECLFHTGRNKTLVPAQPLLPMFLLLIYLKKSSERCKPFCSGHNGVYFFTKHASTMASSCPTNMISVPTTGVILVTSPGMTSLVTSSSSQSPWSVPMEPPPTLTSSSHTTHVARLLTIADTKVMT